jgi:hypothetical protein
MSYWDLVVVAVLAAIFAVHRSERTLRFFWLGLACAAAWAGWLALPRYAGVNDHAWWWIAIDLPLNFSWMVAWLWPFYRQRFSARPVTNSPDSHTGRRGLRSSGTGGPG